MAIPLAYSVRNLLTRRLTTILTVAGMALVVFVFAAMLMLAAGLKQTLVETGMPDNVVVIREGAVSEVQSGIERQKAAVIETDAGIASGPSGERLVAKEIVVLISLPKRDADKPANVVIRGIAPASFLLRPQLRLIEGRLPRAGSDEIAAGVNIARRFKGAGLGETLRFGMRQWRIVGVFDAGNTGFSSEIWGDADQLMQAFRRPVYSSVVFRLRDAQSFVDVKSRLEADPRLRVEAKRETQYYQDQSEMMATFLRVMGISLTLIFSLGAVIGAMITMYAAVSNRTGEIGALRALGFQRSNILISFLVEALLLGCIGGVVGLFFASFMQLFTVSTMNFQTFSELAFGFHLTFEIIWQAMGFSLFMGLLGGMAPAIRASRMKIVDALRTV